MIKIYKGKVNMKSTNQSTDLKNIIWINYDDG